MILYHFTAKSRVAAIMAEGLTRGDVPITLADEGLNGVWLTTSSDSTAHGLGVAREMTEAEREYMGRWRGVVPPAGTMWEDKRAVRIRVKMPSSDSRLKHWWNWSKRRVDPSCRASLIEAGGGPDKARSWYIYFGVIAPADFETIDQMEFTNSSP